MMAGLEGRVSFLEAKVDAHSESINGIRDALVHLEHRIELRFQGVEQRFQGMDVRFQSLDDKMSRQFLWLVGMQMTTLATVVAALIAALKR